MSTLDAQHAVNAHRHQSAFIGFSQRQLVAKWNGDYVGNEGAIKRCQQSHGHCRSDGFGVAEIHQHLHQTNKRADHAHGGCDLSPRRPYFRAPCLPVQKLLTVFVEDLADYLPT